MRPPCLGSGASGPSGFGRSPSLSRAVEPHGVLPTRDSLKQEMVRGGIPLAFPMNCTRRVLARGRTACRLGKSGGRHDR